MTTPHRSRATHVPKPTSISCDSSFNSIKVTFGPKIVKYTHACKTRDKGNRSLTFLSLLLLDVLVRRKKARRGQRSGREKQLRRLRKAYATPGEFDPVTSFGDRCFAPPPLLCRTATRDLCRRCPQRPSGHPGAYPATSLVSLRWLPSTSRSV